MSFGLAFRSDVFTQFFLHFIPDETGANSKKKIKATKESILRDEIVNKDQLAKFKIQTGKIKLSKK